jgi:hypothetical protein
MKATGAHIGFRGHITRPELLKYLSDTEQRNGLQIVCCGAASGEASTF